MLKVVFIPWVGALVVAAAGLVGTTAGAGEPQRDFPIRATGYVAVVDEAFLQNSLRKQGEGYCTMALKHSGHTITDYACAFSGDGERRTQTCRAVAHCTGDDVRREWRPGQGSAQ